MSSKNTTLCQIHVRITMQFVNSVHRLHYSLVDKITRNTCKKQSVKKQLVNTFNIERTEAAMINNSFICEKY